MLPSLPTSSLRLRMGSRLEGCHHPSKHKPGHPEPRWPSEPGLTGGGSSHSHRNQETCHAQAPGARVSLQRVLRGVGDGWETAVWPRRPGACCVVVASGKR